jgi:hypothetical protein
MSTLLCDALLTQRTNGILRYAQDDSLCLLIISASYLSF